MRLSDLTPERVADDCARAVQEYVATLALRVNMGANIDVSQWPCEQLRWAAQELAAYAIRGATLDAPAVEYVQSLAEALYIRPSDRGTYDTEDFTADELDTSWGVVIAAALAREKVLGGEDVIASELALLASLSTDAVVRLLRAGEIPTREMRDSSQPGKPRALVTALQARRWLSGRGVPGF